MKSGKDAEQLRTFYNFNKELLQFFAAVDRQFIALLDGPAMDADATAEILKQYKEVLPDLNSLKLEMDMLDESSISDTCRHELDKLRKYITSTMLLNQVPFTKQKFMEVLDKNNKLFGAEYAQKQELLKQKAEKEEKERQLKLKKQQEEEARKKAFEVDMVKVEGGSFTLLDSKCNVTLSTYFISKYPVTQALWEAVMNSNPSSFKGKNLPVETVNWYDAQEFISKLNALTGKAYRLPTEAEWEYAARGGNKSKGYEYAGSNNLYEVGWYSQNAGSTTHSVGEKKPNELGIYDMSGNVWEWCSDWFGTYPTGSHTNPQGAASGGLRVLRGGSWYYDAEFCRCASRLYYTPDFRNINIGFRLVSPQ